MATPRAFCSLNEIIVWAQGKAEEDQQPIPLGDQRGMHTSRS